MLEFASQCFLIEMGREREKKKLSLQLKVSLITARAVVYSVYSHVAYQKFTTLKIATDQRPAQFNLEMFKVRYKTIKKHCHHSRQYVRPFVMPNIALCQSDKLRFGKRKIKTNVENCRSPHTRSFPFNWLLVCTQIYLQTCTLNTMDFFFSCHYETKL